MKVVDNESYLKEMLFLLQENRQIVIPVSGNSMTPFLCGGRDFVMLRKCEKNELRTGDIVLYQRIQGQFVLHRIQKIRGQNFYAIGDAQRVTEGPISVERICGKVYGIQRKGRWIGHRNFFDWFFKKIWIHVIPLRRHILIIWNRIHFCLAFCFQKCGKQI